MRSRFFAAALLLSLVPGTVHSAIPSGPDLVATWESAQLLAPAPKPNQRTTIEGLFVVRNAGNQGAPASRVRVYLRPDRPGVNVRDARVSRFLTTLDVPALLPGQRWNGRLAYELEPGLDAAGLRLTVVTNASGVVADANAANNEATSSPIPPFGATGVTGAGAVRVEGPFER